MATGDGLSVRDAGQVALVDVVPPPEPPQTIPPPPAPDSTPTQEARDATIAQTGADPPPAGRSPHLTPPARVFGRSPRLPFPAQLTGA